MSAYIIVRIDVTDPHLLKEYQKVAPEIVDKYDGKFIARGGETITLEGTEERRKIVLLEFPTLNRAKEFFDSNEYQEAIKLREDIARFEMVAIEGV